MNLLSDPSFDLAPGQPGAWSPRGEHAAACRVEEGREGGACLRFQGIVGRARWESAPAMLPGGPLALTWWTRIVGREPWHWSYLANYLGPVVRWLDAGGCEVGEEPHRMRCIRTEGWVRAWLLLSPPAGAVQATVSFVWDVPFESDGAMWVDDVCLRPAAPVAGEGEGLLSLSVVDAQTGRPLEARLYLEDAQGRPLRPEFCFDYPTLGGAFHVPTPQPWVFPVPAGRLRLRAMRGFAWRPWQGEIEVTAGGTTALPVYLEPLADLPARGWYCGDHHSHLFFHGHTRHPQMTPAMAMAVARGEGLNYYPLQAEMTEVLANFAHHRVEAREGFVGEFGLESVSDFWGHMCNLNLQSEMPGGFPMRQVLQPMNLDVFRSSLPAGGAIVYPHPLNGASEPEIIPAMGDPTRMLLARELPIDLAEGFSCGYDLMGEDDPEGLEAKLAEYYRLLDMGFRVAATAATDYYVDQGAGVPGAVRTYVKAESLDFAAIAAGYRQAATYCTNGPLVSFTVNGTGPGNEVGPLAPGADLQVALNAWSAWGVGEVELLREGEVILSLDAGDRDSFTHTLSLPADASCWLALRVWGPPAPEVDSRVLPQAGIARRGQFAHTSPVWVAVTGRPRRPRAETVRHYLEWIAAVRRAVAGNADRLLPQDAKRLARDPREMLAQITRRLDRAEKFYRGFLDE